MFNNQIIAGAAGQGGSFYYYKDTEVSCGLMTAVALFYIEHQVAHQIVKLEF